jgi:glucose 1-dehydrogenase
MQLHGKIALVTGAGRGIGQGCAVELAKRGATVIVNDRPGSPDLAATVQKLQHAEAQAIGLEGDVFQREGCEQLVARVLEEAGRIDILVSNPAFSRRCSFLDYEPDVFEKTLQGTLTSGFHMSQLVARHMVQRGGGGKILFISSVQAEMPIGRCVAYGAAKAGLNHMMRSIAVELAQHRINVNAIEPGWIDTPGEHETFSEEFVVEQGRLLPWSRLGTPEDIGKAAAFLVSDDADYITGEVLAVDGLFRWKDCRIPD